MLNSSEGEKFQKILEIIDNGETQLPDFQRGWVWEDRRSHIVRNSFRFASCLQLTRNFGMEQITKTSSGHGIGAGCFVEGRYRDE